MIAIDENLIYEHNLTSQIKQVAIREDKSGILTTRAVKIRLFCVNASVVVSLDESQ